jgi:hypothetical protein
LEVEMTKRRIAELVVVVVVFAGCGLAMGAVMGDYGGGFRTASFLLVGLTVYFLPTLLARQRKAQISRAVFAVNLLLGWTFIGWFVAIAMAAGGRPAASVQPVAAPMMSPDGKT